jgi:predicted amino acid racemase
METSGRERSHAGRLGNARLTVDLGKIEDNVRTLVARLDGIDLVAVTKGVCGSPEVARAMIAGGAVALADSRHENAARLRDAGMDVPIWLLRSPSPARADETVRLFDLSLVTEKETCRALDEAAALNGRRHAVLLMVELGDLREGIMPKSLPRFARLVEDLEHLELAGIGANLACFAGIVPDEHNMGQLLGLASATEARVGHRLIVSGGNSSAIPMATAGRLPAGISSLRVGESALHGTDTLTRWPLPGLHVDAFMLEVPVVECRKKPSLPYGSVAQNAWGDSPTFVDRGVRRRAICALGKQDCFIKGLTPLDPRINVLGASSDHIVLDVDALLVPPRTGEAVRFRPNYAATAQLFASPYVDKVFRAVG